MNKRLLSLYGVMVLASALPACVSLEATKHVDQLLIDEAARFKAPPSWAFPTDVDDAIAADWSIAFSDPRLSALIDEAFANNPSIIASAESVARAQALLRQSRSEQFPTLSASLSGSGADPLDARSATDGYAGSLQANWEADLWGRISARVLASNFDLAASEQIHRGARQALAANVARAYLGTIETQLQLELAQSTTRALEQILRIVTVRYDGGAASRREVVLAESDLASARDTEAVAKANTRAAARFLQVLLGRYADADFEPPEAFPTFVADVNPGRPADILRRRPDVAAAEFDVRAAFADIDAAYAARWPRLTLSGDLTSLSDTIGGVFDGPSAAFGIGARLADTLFDGGLTRSQIEAAEAAGRQALAFYGQTVLDAFAEVEGRLDDIATLSERRTFIANGASAARETLRLAEIQYDEGAIDLLDVLTFRQRSFQAERALLAIQRQELESRIALLLAVGAIDLDNAPVTLARE